MTKFTAALSLLLLSASSGVLAAPSLSQQARISSRTNPQLRAKEQKRSAKLNEKIKSLATPRNLANNYYGNNYNNQYNNQYNNNNQYGNGNGNYYNDGEDGQQAADYNWNQYMEQEAFGFNMPNFSMKFTQCATVQSYSDYLAEDEDAETVLAAQRFALFRLCPSDQCSSNTETGCDNGYGEYVVSMDQYLSAVVEAEEERVQGYCTYCQECATIESAKFFWQEVESRKEAAIEAAQQAYEQWYETYVTNYGQQQQQNDQYGQANEENQDAYDNAYNQYANQYQGENEQGDYNNNNAQDQDAAQLAQRYYNYVRQRAQYANNYANNYGNNNNGNNNGNQNPYYAMNQPQWDNSQMWEFQQKAQRQYQNQNAWASMGSGSFGSFFGQTVLNGYFDQNGDFIQSYGYFNCKGYFVSLDGAASEQYRQNNYNWNNGQNGQDGQDGDEEQQYDDQVMEWDACLWGEMPDNWDGIGPDTLSCNYDYAGSCYNQYDACMEILQDQDYQNYQNGYQAMNGNYVNGNNQYQDGEQNRPLKMKDFIECTRVDPVSDSNSEYANQEKYAAQYEAKQEYFATQFNCYDGDEECEQKREYAMAQWSYAHKVDYNREYYIGPHCSNTGRQISLAVYKDEFCSVIDEESTVEEILGYSVSENMNFVPNDCIKCRHDQWEIQDENLQWYEDEQVDEQQIEPMCSMLFQLSGKCQKNLKMGDFYNYNGYNVQENEADDMWQQMYQSAQQAGNEDSVCSFIESLRSNTYDENGDIVLDGGQVWKNPAQWNREFEAESKALGAGKKVTLAFLAIATAIMAAWACFLHGTLARKNIPWQTKNRRKGEDATDIARQNSGIVMGRSRSGPGSQPLI